MIIRQAIESGHVDLAIRHINELDAEVRLSSRLLSPSRKWVLT